MGIRDRRGAVDLRQVQPRRARPGQSAGLRDKGEEESKRHGLLGNLVSQRGDGADQQGNIAVAAETVVAGFDERDVYKRQACISASTAVPIV